MPVAPISLLLGGTTYGNHPADETLASTFFPRQRLKRVGSSRPLRSKKGVRSGAPLRCAPSGFIVVALPMTVSPSQGIGPSRPTEEDRP
jgi:hypothetical protein